MRRWEWAEESVGRQPAQCEPGRLLDDKATAPGSWPDQLFEVAAERAIDSGVTCAPSGSRKHGKWP